VKFKLIIVMTEDDLTDRAIEVARAHGATGCTVISSARGEGLKPAATFLGLTLEGQRDMIMLLVERQAEKCRGGLQALATRAGDHGASGGPVGACDLDRPVGQIVFRHNDDQFKFHGPAPSSALILSH